MSLTDSIKEMEGNYIVPTYKRVDVVFERGEGVYLYDIEGKKYIDFISGIATIPLGHSHSIVTKAINEQAGKIINVSNLFYTKPQIELAKRLIEISGIRGKVFFSNSGAEAIETALKFVRKHTGKKGIIAAKNGFHGRTFGALSATWKDKYRKPFEPLLSGFKHIHYNSLEQLRINIDEDTAAFIVEPIQGEAGVIVPANGYLKEAAQICASKNVLFIVDEIQSCLGRTGKFFAFQYEELKPDIIVLAKGLSNGLPIGATIVKDCIANSIEVGEHGSTFGGNALCTYVGAKVVDYIIENGLQNNAIKVGNYFIKRLKEISKKHLLIKEIRGRGLMVAIELNDGSARDIVNEALKNNLVINNTSETTLRFLPPLIITEEQIDEAVCILDSIIKKQEV